MPGFMDLYYKVAEFIKKILKKHFFVFYPFIISGVIRIVGAMASIQISTVTALKGTIFENANSVWSIVSIMCQIIEIIIFGIWYFIQFRMKKKEREKRDVIALRMKDILHISLLFVIINILIDNVYALAIKSKIVAISEEGNSFYIWGLAGTLLLTCLITPICEELIYRGVMFNIAREIGTPFWYANIAQALIFGIAHSDVIQKIYAFCIALLLGFLYERYRCIILTILLHALFNVWGAVLSDTALSYPIGGNVVLSVISALSILGVGAYIFVCKKEKEVAREKVLPDNNADN